MLWCAIAARGQIVDIYRKPAQQSTQEQERMLRHLVLYKFRDGIPADTLHRLEKAFTPFPGKYRS